MATAGTLSVASFDTTGTLGLVTSNGNGTFNYDPNGGFESLAAGQSATDSFSYTLSDGQGGTDTATVTVTVQGRDETSPPPPPSADIALTLGVLETGEYGNNYNGLTDDDGQVTASFQSTGSHLTLSLKGYDVNYATEVQVLLNGDSIGFLTPGPNEQLNAGDTFILSATDQQAGEKHPDLPGREPVPVVGRHRNPARGGPAAGRHSSHARGAGNRRIWQQL